LTFYRKAALQGHANAQNNLGAMYENGEGVPKSREEALKWYKLAAGQGNEWAQRNLDKLQGSVASAGTLAQ
jgi:TPR repeat protein